MIPLGFKNGKFSAMVQVAIPGSTRPDTTWDLGLTLLSGTRRPWKTSKRLMVASPGVPVILEVVTTFDPGPFELVFVSRELDTDVISAGHLDGEWPRPRDQAASIGPIALLQPGSGAFVRDGEVIAAQDRTFVAAAKADLEASADGTR